MRSKNILTRYTLEIGGLIGIITTLLSFCTTFYWQYKGFTPSTTILLTIVAGFYLFIIILLMHFFKTKRILKKEGIPKYKRRYLVLFILLVALVTYLIFDSLIFLIDPSISQHYMDLLNNLTTDEKDTITQAWPLGFINSFITIFFGMIASFISIFFLRKSEDIIPS